MATTITKLFPTGILQSSVEFDEVTPASGTTTGSAQFSGSNYLTVPNNVALNPGTGNFTIEFWIYLNSATANASLYRGQSGGADIFLNGSSKLSFGQAGISTLIVDTANMTTGAWVHVAAVKNGGSITLYKNGAVVGSTGSAPNFVTTTITYIGSNGTWYVNGNITNLRVVIGSAVYTGVFTPPTSPLTAISGTQLLLLEDSNSNLLKDSSTNNFTVTNNGTVTWSALSPSFASSTAVRISTSGVYANQFDEVGLTAGTAERRTSTGTYMVSGEFDEYTLTLPAPSLNLYTTTVANPVSVVGTVSTYSNIFVGPESPNRILVASIISAGASSSFITNVTIGGVTATRRAGRTAGDFVQADIWSAIVPTGTSVGVVVTTNTGSNGSQLWIHTVYGYNNANWVGATDFQASNSSTLLMDATLTFPADSIGIAIYNGANIQRTASRIWSGLTFVAETTADPDTTTSAVANDVILTSLAAQTGLTAGVRVVSFDSSDPTRRRPAFAVVGFN